MVGCPGPSMGVKKVALSVARCLIQLSPRLSQSSCRCLLKMLLWGSRFFVDSTVQVLVFDLSQCVGATCLRNLASPVQSSPVFFVALGEKVVWFSLVVVVVVVVVVGSDVLFTRVSATFARYFSYGLRGRFSNGLSKKTLHVDCTGASFDRLFSRHLQGHFRAACLGDSATADQQNLFGLHTRVVSRNQMVRTPAHANPPQHTRLPSGKNTREPDQHCTHASQMIRTPGHPLTRTRSALHTCLAQGKNSSRAPAQHCTHACQTCARSALRARLHTCAPAQHCTRASSAHMPKW